MANADAATQILRDLKDIPFGQIAILVAASTGAIALSSRVVPVVAERLPPAFRPYLLPWPPLLRLVLTITVTLTCAVLIVRPDASAVAALLGSLAVAVGFALKDYVSSLAAGVMVLFEQPYTVGDWIRIDGHYGEVVAVGFRAVALKTVDDDRVTVPHGKAWTESIVNATGGQLRLQVQTFFYLDPSHDAEVVAGVLRDVTLTSPFLATERPVLIRVEQTPWATKYCVRAYPIEPRDQFVFRTDLTIRGRAALEKLGVVPARALGPVPEHRASRRP